MIQPLRNAHRSIFLLLGICLPILFVSAIASRHGNPEDSEPHLEELTIARTLGEKPIRFGDHQVTLRLIRLDAYEEPRQYKFSHRGTFAAPELLVYWSASDAGSALPSEAALIGAFTEGKGFSLGADKVDKGFLLVYDGAHKRLLAAFPLGQH